MVYSYMHCGKAIGDICKKNKECASKKCLDYSGYSNCGTVGGPSDSDGSLHFIYLFAFFIAVQIIIFFYYYIILIIKYRNNLFIISLILGITVFFLYNLYIFMNLN